MDLRMMKTTNYPSMDLAFRCKNINPKSLKTNFSLKRLTSIKSSLLKNTKKTNNNNL